MKNSVGMLAAHHFSHKTLTGVSVQEGTAMIADKGILWDELDDEDVHSLPVWNDLPGSVHACATGEAVLVAYRNDRDALSPAVSG